jgi:hypothetical protein
MKATEFLTIANNNFILVQDLLVYLVISYSAAKTKIISDRLINICWYLENKR